MDTGEVEEIESPITVAHMISRFKDTDTRFRLAAGVAEFSEILRANPFARGSSFEDVARVLEPVALELGLDGRVQELLRLVHGAGSMSRGR